MNSSYNTNLQNIIYRVNLDYFPCASGILGANLLIDIMMITKTGDFLKKVVLNIFLFESAPIWIAPGILLT
jgi:hypothetical protein